MGPETWACVLMGPALLCLIRPWAPKGESRPEKQEQSRAHARMVAELRRHGIRDRRVLAAMSRVRRHAFVPEPYRIRYDPYGDHPCPIGHGQTISQPFIVAYMTERIGIKPGDKVLEIGTGSGYQAAVLAELGAEVYGVECIPELADNARATLAAEGYGSVQVLTGDGYRGWPEHAPYDAVIIACAPENVPAALPDQLREGGRMVLPVGSGVQRLVVLEKERDGVRRRDDILVRFVPMVRG